MDMLNMASGTEFDFDEPYSRLSHHPSTSEVLSTLRPRLVSQQENADKLLSVASSLIGVVDEGTWENQTDEWITYASRFVNAYELYNLFFADKKKLCRPWLSHLLVFLLGAAAIACFSGCTPGPHVPVPQPPAHIEVKADPYPFVLPIAAFSIATADLTPTPVPSPNNTVKVGDTCPVCNGSGWNEADHNPANRTKCVQCRGDGKVDAGDPILGVSSSQEKSAGEDTHVLDIHVISKDKQSLLDEYLEDVAPLVPPGDLSPRYVRINGEEYYFSSDFKKLVLDNDPSATIEIKAPEGWKPNKGDFLNLGNKKLAIH